MINDLYIRACPNVCYPYRACPTHVMPVVHVVPVPFIITHTGHCQSATVCHLPHRVQIGFVRNKNSVLKKRKLFLHPHQAVARIVI
jgi:hypothetical protein